MPYHSFAATWTVPNSIDFTINPNCSDLLTDAAKLLIEDTGARHLPRQVILWNTLVAALKRVPSYAPVQGRPVHILNLASGSGYESYLLSAFFSSGKFLVPSDQGLVNSVDRSRTAIESAQLDQAYVVKHAVGGKELVSPVRFIVADATQPETFTEFNLPLDIVWIRHPEVTDDFIQGRQIWPTLIKNAVSQLRNGGIVIMTHYSKYEGRMADNILRRADIDVVIESEENPAVPIELKGTATIAPKDPHDLFITVGVKP